jgi:hypothetical protein
MPEQKNSDRRRDSTESEDEMDNQPPISLACA